jgi:hypothetical protein
MPDNIFVQFVAELLRTLLVDEISSHVRKKLYKRLGWDFAKDIATVVLEIHRQNRNRLLNRMLTGVEENP